MHLQADAQAVLWHALLAGQNEALQLAVNGAALAQVLEVLTHTAESQSDGGILASVLLLDEDGQHLRHGAAPSLPGSYNAAIDGIAIGPAVGSCGSAAYRDQVVEVEDIASDPLWTDFRDLALQHGLRACWSTPVRSSAGQVLGTFALYYREARGPTPHDRQVVQLLANTAAVVIERYHETRDRERVEASLRRRADVLARLAGASRTINASLSVGEVTGVLTEQARQIIEAHRAVTTLTDGDGGQVVETVSLSDSHALARTDGERPPARGFDARVRRSNQPLRLARQELEQLPDGPMPGAGITGATMRGYLAAPLVGQGGRNLGLVQLSDKVEGDFTADDEAILVQLAAIAAVAIENARLYGEQRDANRRKDEFLATLAHELRNPLAPIGNAIALLRRTRAADGGLHAIDIMERQLRHLVRLVDDLLDVSRITTGKIVLQPEPLQLQAVVDAAVETAAPTIRRCGHQLEVSLPQEPQLLTGDRTRLAQVFTNLLLNAAKYTPPGGRIRLLAQADGGWLQVQVSDNGLGLAPDMLPRIFEAFVQVEHALPHAQGGLGLGLTLVRELVGLHGGEVRAHSDGPGRGTTFTVRLPMRAVPAATVACGDPQPAWGSPSRAVGACPVLVVDDNRDAADSLVAVLELAGHPAAAAHTGQQAIERATELLPRAVLLDIGLPDLSGLEVAQRLRALAGERPLALIALTGWGTEQDRRRTRQAGFDHHLTKPAQVDEVLALLQHLTAHPAAAAGPGTGVERRQDQAPGG